MIDNDEELIEKCRKFLTRSSQRYSSQVSKQVSDLEAFNGNFWTDAVKKQYLRTGKRKYCLHFSDWSVLANAIVSPYAKSPWHDALIDRYGEFGEIQEAINQLEPESDIKHEFKKALLRGVVAGAGYVVATTVADEVTGEPKITVEFVTRQASVALDPMCERVDASDAEEGALVNYISISKAKRLYGDDIVPYMYPQNAPRLSVTGINQWPNLQDCVQVVSYYAKNEQGFVDYYKICGNRVVERIGLPIRFIPIIRFAGYEKYDTDFTKYAGIVDKTYSLQLGLNIAYSTLMERANRSIKANVIMSTAAGANLDPYYEKKEDEDGSVIMYNQGADVPQVIKESFETGDLANVITVTRNLIADVIGVPLAGVEFLIQNNSQESNVSIFFDNAYMACRTFGRIVIQLLTGGEDIPFELENGPDVITNNLKHRQELSAIAQVMPQEMQPLVAVHMCDTIDSDFVDKVKADIVANLGEQLKLVSEQPSDPVAIHELETMKAMMESAMEQIDELKKNNDELDQQNKSLQLQLQNQKERNIVDLAKHQDQLELDQAKLELEAQKQGVELELDVADKQSELAKEALDIEEKKLDIMEGMVRV